MRLYNRSHCEILASSIYSGCHTLILLGLLSKYYTVQTKLVYSRKKTLVSLSQVVKKPFLVIPDIVINAKIDFSSKH